MTRVAVVGAGYVGLVSAACFAELGHTCTCVDVDPRKVERINAGEAPIHERGLPELLARHAGKGLRATTDLPAAVADADMSFIAVGTPFDGQRIDLTQVIGAATQIGAALRRARPHHVVVVKSTVVPGTTDEVVTPALERASGLRAGRDFSVGMNPEFLTEGVAVDDFLRPDRIVIGGDAQAVAAQRELYAPFDGVPIIVTNSKTAEMIKYASNSVLATMISFANEFAALCDALGGVDVADVMRGVHAARYFQTVQTVQAVPGERGGDERRVAAPLTSFLWAGCGYGGSCLPKDTQALAAHGAAHGAAMPLLEAVIARNASQPARVIDLLRRHHGDPAGLKVAVLGLAFKEDTDDVRESPAIPIVRALLDAGCIVTAYDPVARDSARVALSGLDVRLVDGLQQAVDAQDALVIATRWDEFRQLPALLRGRAAQPLVIDGRRMLDPATVDRYAGIGAGVKSPNHRSNSSEVEHV